jgi:hypothetical protein
VVNVRKEYFTFLQVNQFEERIRIVNVKKIIKKVGEFYNKLFLSSSFPRVIKNRLDIIVVLRKRLKKKRP